MIHEFKGLVLIEFVLQSDGELLLTTPLFGSLYTFSTLPLLLLLLRSSISHILYLYTCRSLALTRCISYSMNCIAITHWKRHFNRFEKFYEFHRWCDLQNCETSIPVEYSRKCSNGRDILVYFLLMSNLWVRLVDMLCSLWLLSSSLFVLWDGFLLFGEMVLYVQ